MRIELILSAEDGEWRAYGPDKHYRTFRSLSELPEVVAKLIEDHAEWLRRRIKAE